MSKTVYPLAALAIIALCANVTAAFGESDDPHAAHRKMMSEPKTSIETVDYSIPDIELTDSTGARRNLRELLDSDEPLVVNFIYTTCTTICPVITATTLQLQRELQSVAEQPTYITISIDPDYDSAVVLREYANNYGADWTFLTGSSDEVMTALKALDAYRGNKVNHFALVLMKPSRNAQWTRVEGLTSADALATIWRDSST